MAKSGVRNRLAELRTRRGIGPSELAAQVGISRQTVYAIETGAYVPNTAVSLRLARALDTSIDEIFQLEEEKPQAVETAEAIVLGDANSLTPGRSLRLCQVDNHLVAVAPEPGGWGLPSADAILLSLHGKRPSLARVQIVGGEWRGSGRILVAGCDPSASILAGAVQRQGCELVIAYVNSSLALELLGAGLVHVAGTHLDSHPGEGGQTGFFPNADKFPDNSVVVFCYATWREGLVVAAGNPKQIQGIEDFKRQDVTIANREPGAGCRQLLDDLLETKGIARNSVRGYGRIVRGQLPAARLVQSGEVDCCVCAEAGARALGLGFVPLAVKPYHLVVDRKHLELRPVQVLLETLGRLSFRREVEICVGYDMHRSGERVC